MKKFCSVVALVLLLLSACTRENDDRPTAPVELGRSEITRTIGDRFASLVIEVEPPVAVVGDEITWRLHNRGDVVISYGRAYHIERRTLDSWTVVPNHISFTWDLPALRPGDSTDPATLAVYDKKGDRVQLGAGTYRFILRGVHLGPAERAESTRVTAEFRIRADG